MIAVERIHDIASYIRWRFSRNGWGKTWRGTGNFRSG